MASGECAGELDGGGVAGGGAGGGTAVAGGCGVGRDGGAGKLFWGVSTAAVLEIRKWRMVNDKW